MPPTKLLLANAVAYLALAAVLAETRRELSAVRAEHHSPHRALGGEEPGGDAMTRGAEANEEKWVTAEAEGADVEPPETGDDEKESLLLMARVEALSSEMGALKADNVLLHERAARLSGRVDELETTCVRKDAEEDGADSSGAAEGAAGPRATGGRRLQAGKCNGPELGTRTDAITVECCDEPDEDCSDGYPHTCNAWCAALLLPFWTDCRAALGKEASQFEATVALCAPPPAPAGAAQVFSRVCASVDLASCVPPCDASVSGFMLHIEIDGQGTTMTCNRYDGTFSWQGLASLGGYVQTDGADVGAFFSAVVSGAAGVCVIL